MSNKFEIKCDEENNPKESIEEGNLIVDFKILVKVPPSFEEFLDWRNGWVSKEISDFMLGEKE